MVDESFGWGDVFLSRFGFVVVFFAGREKKRHKKSGQPGEFLPWCVIHATI